MPKYVIERTVPGAGELSHDQLRELAGHSNDVLRSLGPDVQWVHSYVAGESPADRITEVAAIIDPTTTEP
jgi:hypothetical protein